MLNALLLCKSGNLITLLQKCKSLSDFKQMHSIIITSGLPLTAFVSPFLSFAAISSNNMDYAYAIFLQLPNPTIFHWNTLIRGYSKARNPNKSISVFVDMLRMGVTPDHLTYPFLAKSASHLKESRLGLSVHGRVVRDGYEADRFVKNSLIHFAASFKDVAYARKLFDEMPNKNLVSWNSMLDCYVKCRDVLLAREVFDLMPERDVVTWSSMIDGYVKGNEYSEALAIFEKMHVSGINANEVTMVSVLGACAHLGALEQGIMMHRYIVDRNIALTLVLRTSLVDMYAKCGAIEDALAVFRGALAKQTDVLIWNAMIGGLATHGFVHKSLDMFTEMQNTGITPDEITYLCILSACAHGGLVNEAWYYFKCLTQNGLNPKIEHYACMMDALARAGQLTEAYTFLSQMPTEPTASMLGALFNGCINHRNLDLAEVVGKKLVELEPDHDGRYVGLSNVYAVIKRWDKARTLREAMENRGVKKSPGWSFVEILGSPHRNVQHDKIGPHRLENLEDGNREQNSMILSPNPLMKATVKEAMLHSLNMTCTTDIDDHSNQYHITTLLEHLPNRNRLLRDPPQQALNFAQSHNCLLTGS